MIENFFIVIVIWCSGGSRSPVEQRACLDQKLKCVVSGHFTPEDTVAMSYECLDKADPVLGTK